MHERIKNLRREFLHQTTTELVPTSAVLATEELKIQNMSRSATGTVEKSGRMVQQKAGLNREILSLGLSMTHCPAIKIAHRWYSSTRTRLEREWRRDPNRWRGNAPSQRLRPAKPTLQLRMQFSGGRVQKSLSNALPFR